MQKHHGDERSVATGARAARLVRRALALAVVASIAGAVVYVSLLPSGQRPLGRRALARGPVPVTVAPARTADVPLYLEGVGTAKARNTVTVRPQVDGRIVSIEFKEGQDVKRGEVLARLDPDTYQAKLDEALAKKALDEAELANARHDLARYARLGGNIIAQKTIDTQKALVAKLTAQLKLDDAAIANASAVLAYTTIKAPIDGRTGIRMVDTGNLVRASDAGIVVITELRPMNVLFTLPQQQLARVRKAQGEGVLAVEVLNAAGRTTLDRGTLKVIDNQIDQATGTVRMKAEFPNARLQLWPGQFVNVRLRIDTLEKVVVIPTPAVRRGPGGTFAYVLQPDDRVSVRPISVKHQFESETAVAHGIAAGERVVTTGFSRLKDGTRVSVPGSEEKPSLDPAPAAKAGPRAAAFRAACAADIKKHCAGVERRRAAIGACLRASAPKLSEACRAAARRRGKSRSQGDADNRQRPMRKAESSARQ